MQFLRSDFVDQLTADINPENGNVIVEAAEFTPQQILEFNEEIFEVAFKEWCENKKAAYLEKADEILELYDNRDRFDRLQQIYNRGNVIPFIGAGLSVSSGYIGWTDFLRKIREETTVSEEQLESLIESGQYEEAAQALYDAMPHDTFNEYLTNKFDNDKPLSGCIRFLPYCFSTSVITTNFDNVLKRCYDDAQKPFSEELLGAETVELPSALAQGKNVLVKLHGKASSARNRIITKQEYDQHYSDAKGLSSRIEAIAKNTLLFLGCSLRSDRTVACLKDMLRTNGAEASVRHYTFAAIEDDQAKRLARRDSLAEANIYPIWYSADDDHDECILALLVKLSESSGSMS